MISAAFGLAKEVAETAVPMLQSRNQFFESQQVSVLQHSREIVLAQASAARESLRDSLQMEMDRNNTLMLVRVLGERPPPTTESTTLERYPSRRAPLVPSRDAC